MWFSILENKNKKRSLSSSEDSSDSDNDCFSNYATSSKVEHYDGASCSKTNDSDSNLSDDPPPKATKNNEHNEKSGNKGMSLMVKI